MKGTALATSRLAIVATCLALAPAAGYAELYKYKNEDGVTVLDSHVPARYVRNGYTILSNDGRVLEVVPAALSEEEMEAQADQIAEQKRIEEERRARKERDEELLRVYAGPDDVIRARDTKISNIETFIETQKGNIRRLEGQRRELETNLADIERAGGQVPQSSLSRIRSLNDRIAQVESEVKEKQDEIDTLNASYAADLKRVRQLYGLDPI